VQVDQCKVEGCDQPVHVKQVQFCRLHYSRWNRHGDPLAFKRKQRPSCTIDGCDLPAVGRKLCSKHYSRQKRYGTTELAERPLICSVEDCERLVQALGLCDMHYRRQKAGRAEQRLCLYCGEPVPDGIRGRRSYCCSEHQLIANRDASQRKYRDFWLRTKYGIDVAGYEALLAKQDGCCAICGTTNPKGRTVSPYFCVDHDHSDGRVRGLLCSTCNTGIGHLRDDPDLLRKAIAYLERKVTG
jgi:hypothetical protein